MVYGYAIFGLIVIVVESYRFVVRRDLRFDFRMMFVFWFYKAYVLTPIAILLYGTDALNRHMSVVYEQASMGPSLWIIIISYICYIFAFDYTSKVRVDFSVSDGKIMGLNVWWIIGSIGLLSYLMFMMVYGFDVVLSGNIRYFDREDTSQMGAFFLYGRSFLWMSFFAASALMVIYRKSIFNSTWGVGYMILLCLAMFVTIQGASRAAYALIFIIPYLVLCYEKKRIHRPLYAIMVVSVGLLMLFVGRTVIGHIIFDSSANILEEIYVALTDYDFNTAIEFLSAAYSHPLASLHGAIRYAGNVVDYRFFYDVPLGFLFYLKLVGIDAGSSITYHNTYLSLREYSSTIPPGIIAAGYFQLGILGVVIWMLGFGAFSKKMDSYVKSMTVFPGMSGVYIYAGFVLGNFVMAGDPRVYAIRVSFILAVLFLVRYSGLVKNRPLFVRVSGRKIPVVNA